MQELILSFVPGDDSHGELTRDLEHSSLSSFLTAEVVKEEKKKERYL
jgi:hypothetical protein